jgi:hypothetical protein
VIVDKVTAWGAAGIFCVTVAAGLPLALNLAERIAAPVVYVTPTVTAPPVIRYRPAPPARQPVQPVRRPPAQPPRWWPPTLPTSWVPQPTRTPRPPPSAVPYPMPTVTPTPTMTPEARHPTGTPSPS